MVINCTTALKLLVADENVARVNQQHTRLRDSYDFLRFGVLKDLKTGRVPGDNRGRNIYSF